MFKFEKLVFGDMGWGDEFLIATFMTIAVSICSMGLGIFIAIFAAWAKLSLNKFLKILSNIYTTVVRGVPELLIIYLIFFGGSAAIMSIAKAFGYYGYIELNAFTISVVAIGLISATYSTEVIRASVLSIDKGQFEAAKSMGLKKFQIFYKILIPQVLRHAIPGIGNVWQVTLKDTALISVTGLVEIMRQTRISSNVEHSPFTFLITAAFLYLILTTFSGKFFNFIERKVSKGFV
ncbi:MAG: Octopine transport system permease protein OccQ [Alphaproteobacteria bacterium MarineAlpha5_Bin9]|nr:MAG: Octopine transport system permease protein OccQ [Alphaproteobacteria bacterium MarineAlpha5_Bin9]|tara:strand:+ start:6093 stop:6797 length:705 start_codon:yes stop_codon:yes gene_type:complete